MHDILHALARHAKERGTDTAYRDRGATISYAALARRVAQAATRLEQASTDNGDVIAVLAPNGIDWVVADLAIALAGKTLVPLPPFFSPAQLVHIVRDAKVAHVLHDESTRLGAQSLGDATGVSLGSLEHFTAEDGQEATLGTLERARGAKRVIYTSGTTGTPKGVVVGDRQMSASAHGLLAASKADTDDRHLSVLPFSLLLEQIASICVPLLAGATVELEPHAAAAAQAGDPSVLAAAMETSRPSTAVLVPALLDAWVQYLEASGRTAPESLRFVAVGGAHVPTVLAERAWKLGIPAYEGYGLSECCSVVSVNRPGERVIGTAGKVLDGISVTLENGEIVVQGPTVMDGYLGREPLAAAIWPTGDLGELTEDGALKVLGRKDRLIVTPGGRNIHPDWVETLAQSAPGVAGARLEQDSLAGLVLTLTPHPNMSGDPVSWVEPLLEELPDYARPTKIVTQMAAPPGADAIQSARSPS